MTVKKVQSNVLIFMSGKDENSRTDYFRKIRKIFKTKFQIMANTAEGESKPKERKQKRD